MSFLGGLFNSEALADLTASFTKLSQRIPNEYVRAAEAAHNNLMRASQLALQVNQIKDCDDTPVCLNGIAVSSISNTPLRAPEIYLKGLHVKSWNGDVDEDIHFELAPKSDISWAVLDDVKMSLTFNKVTLYAAEAQRLTKTCHITDSEINGMNFYGSMLGRDEYASSFSGSNAEGAIFTQCDLTNVDFDSCDLGDALMPIETVFLAKNINNPNFYLCYGNQVINDLQFDEDGHIIVETFDRNSRTGFKGQEHPSAFDWVVKKLSSVLERNGIDIPKHSEISITEIPESELVQFGLPDDAIAAIRSKRNSDHRHDGGGKPEPA